MNKLKKGEEMIKALSTDELKKFIGSINVVSDLFIEFALSELESRLSEEDFARYCNEY